VCILVNPHLRPPSASCPAHRRSADLDEFRRCGAARRATTRLRWWSRLEAGRGHRRSGPQVLFGSAHGAGAEKITETATRSRRGNGRCVARGGCMGVRGNKRAPCAGFSGTWSQTRLPGGAESGLVYPNSGSAFLEPLVAGARRGFRLPAGGCRSGPGSLVTDNRRLRRFTRSTIRHAAHRVVDGKRRGSVPRLRQAVAGAARRPRRARGGSSTVGRSPHGRPPWVAAHSAIPAPSAGEHGRLAGFSARPPVQCT